MDTCSAAEVARAFDTSVPRVVRAAQRLGLDARGPTGRWAFTRRMAERLRDELGITPTIPGLDATEVKVLAVLARAPLGLASARVVAGQAAVSPTAASRALRRLEEKGLVRREKTVIAAGLGSDQPSRRRLGASGRGARLGRCRASAGTQHRQ